MKRTPTFAALGSAGRGVERTSPFAAGERSGVTFGRFAKKELKGVAAQGAAGRQFLQPKSPQRPPPTDRAIIAPDCRTPDGGPVLAVRAPTHAGSPPSHLLGSQVVRTHTLQLIISVLIAEGGFIIVACKPTMIQAGTPSAGARGLLRSISPPG